VFRPTAAVACALLLAGPAVAQPEPAARPGSPVETLEAITGERATEPAPERDEIETDRDSFTPATGTAGRGRLITEAAYSFVDNRGVKETHSLPELLLRYGLTDRVELRLGWNYEVGGESAEVSAAGAGEPEAVGSAGRLLREYTLTYGVKVRVIDQGGWVPRSSVILQGLTPTGGSPGTSTTTELVAAYAAGWQLPNRWRFDTALRYGTATEAGDRHSLWAPSAVLRVPVGERVAVHGEYFGIFSTGKAVGTVRHYFSPGVHYLLTDDLEVGVRLGWGLNDQSARFFANTGVGWRF
jgi:hypothetical protein